MPGDKLKLVKPRRLSDDYDRKKRKSPPDSKLDFVFSDNLNRWMASTQKSENRRHNAKRRKLKK